jgi:hypothetical protein
MRYYRDTRLNAQTLLRLVLHYLLWYLPCGLPLPPNSFTLYRAF